MNTVKNILVAGLLGLATLLPASAQSDRSFFAGTGTGTGTFAYAVLPSGKSQSGLLNPSSALLKYLNVTTDTNGAVQFYNVGTPVYCAFTNLGTTAYVNVTNTTLSTSAFTNANGYNGQVLIYHRTTGVYDVRTLGTATAGTNLVTTVATTNQIGDTIWPLALGGTIPVNATTKELNASSGTGGIYMADPGEPLLFSIRGGTNCSINSFSGHCP